MPIVYATMTAAGSHSPVTEAQVDHAMRRAVEQCVEEGITDPDAIKARLRIAIDSVIGR